MKNARVYVDHILDCVEWKDVLHREVEKLPVREGLRKILEKGRVCARQSGIPTTHPLPKVAETRTNYGR